MTLVAPTSSVGMVRKLHRLHVLLPPDVAYTDSRSALLYMGSDKISSVRMLMWP